MRTEQKIAGCTLLILLALLSLPAFALPNIQNEAVTPNNAYLGESIALSFACVTSLPIQGATVSITGPNIIVPDIQLSGGPSYSLSLDQAYIDRTGGFDATVSCADTEGWVNKTINFNVSEITGGIKSISPATLYTNDLMDILFEIKKDGSPVVNGVNFSLFVDNQAVTPKSVVYDTTKGWIIRADAPSSAGTHTIKVVATYTRISLESESSVNVKAPIEFAITSIDKSNVAENDNLTMTIRAFDQGNFIRLPGNIKVYLDSNELSVQSITDDGTNSYVRVVIPNFEKRSYTLKAVLVYKSSTYESTTGIGYTVPAEGEITGIVGATLRFLKSGSERLRMNTDSAGKYYGTIVPGTYDLHLEFPESKLTLEDVEVDDFDDPLDYAVAKDVYIEGISAKTVYFFSFSLEYDKAIVELPYREFYGNSDARIMRCLNWDKAQKKCNISWSEVSGKVSRNGEKVELDLSSLGAFAIGVREKAVLNFNIDSKNYNLKDLIKIRGNVQDSQKNPIPNAKIDVKVGSNVIGNINADSNGVFSIDFLAPDIEGDYTVTIYADKAPYLKGENSKSFTVTKSRSVSILFPEVLRLEPGQQLEKEITFMNTGQDDVTGAEVTVEGVPLGYFTLSKKTIDLPVNAQESVTISFDLPEDASQTTYGATIKLSSGDFSRENSFGLTIRKEEVPAEVQSPATGLAISLPSLDANYIYIAIFAVVCFSAAFLLKKFRKRDKRPSQDMSHLSEIKNHFRSGYSHTNAMKDGLEEMHRRALEKR